MSELNLRVRQRLGKYRIDGRLSEGGFGMVYRATDTVQGIPVALKVPTIGVGDTNMESLQREVRLAARLEHPNVLPIRDATVIDGNLVIATPLGKETLGTRLKRRLTPRAALAFAEQAVEAVAYAHSKRVIHCDIKPDNFILFDDGRLRLGDFGIGRLAVGTRTLEGSGSGTVGYLAPEQAMGKPSLRSDVFSLCLVMFRMFGGRLPEWPFEWPLVGHERAEQILSPEMMALLRRGLIVEARRRFPDGVQLAEAFRAALPKAIRERRSKRRVADRETSVCVIDGRWARPETAPLGGGEMAMFTSPRSEHARNQDVMGFVRMDRGSGVLFVADGAGGHPAGDQAARAAAQALVKAAEAGRRLRLPAREVVLNGIEQGNEAVRKLRKGAATTMTVAIVRPDGLRVAHVGDSLAVCYGQRGAVKMQILPHGPVGYAVRAGLIDEDDALGHDDAHVLSNLLGMREMRIELGPFVPTSGRDTLVLASDGLWDNLSRDEVGEIVRRGSLSRAAEELANACRERMATPTGKVDDLAFVLYRSAASR